MADTKLESMDDASLEDNHKSDIATHVHDADVDVIEVTTKRPYREVNFLMTYLAAGLGALASFGGFVMPATSLALINEDIGASNAFPYSLSIRADDSHYQDHRPVLHGLHCPGLFAFLWATP